MHLHSLVEEPGVGPATDSNTLEFRRRASVTATGSLSCARAKSPHQAATSGFQPRPSGGSIFYLSLFSLSSEWDKHRVFLATNGTVGERGIALQGSKGTATLTTPRSMSESQLRPQPTHKPTQAGNLRAF